MDSAVSVDDVFGEITVAYYSRSNVQPDTTRYTQYDTKYLPGIDIMLLLYFVYNTIQSAYHEYTACTWHTIRHNIVE